MTRLLPEILTLGRSGVDIYPLQIGVGLEDVTSFGKFLGGSPTNVAVAAAQYGHRAAVITAVGDDPFGIFVRRELERLGVDTAYVSVNARLQTPVTFCEVFPPDHFPLYFYRQPSAPDLEITADDLPVDAIAAATVFVVTGTGLSAQPSRDAHHHALAMRTDGWTIADLDYRPTLWESDRQAREEMQNILGSVDIAIGNQVECQMAVGEDDPEKAADALLSCGPRIAIVKQGRAGTLVRTRDSRFHVPATPVQTRNGLGAGDAMTGALCHGLIEGWDLPDAVSYASTAGAIVASRLECSTAMPTDADIRALQAQHLDVTPQIQEKI